MDSNPRDYAAWRLKGQQLLPVVPGRQLDLQWSEVFSIGAGRNGDVSYPDLPSGQYQFRVRDVNALGVPTGEEAVLPLIIAPPFYSNLWFRAALLVSLLAIALSMVSDAAALEAEPGSRQEQRLNEICETSRQLTRTMEEIVWAQDPKHDSLDNMVSYFCSFASDLLGVARIACRLDIPIELPNFPLEAEQRHDLFLVFKETLNNIIKHSGATEVRISLRIVDETIHLAIEDNGRGFQQADAPPGKGNGLSNMKNRLLRLGGKVGIHSEPGGGTRVEIIQPIRPQPKNTQ
jgi:signal transduction histidine kinase